MGGRNERHSHSHIVGYGLVGFVANMTGGYLWWNDEPPNRLE